MIGENFPYSNFHDMNMDWIIKIAKDFLDQYTSIQNIIDTGESTLSQLAESLESDLNDWYNEKSEELAQAVADDLQAISDAAESALADFNEDAQAIITALLATIPADYSTLSTAVTNLQDNVGVYGNKAIISKEYISSVDSSLSLASYGRNTMYAFNLPLSDANNITDLPNDVKTTGTYVRFNIITLYGQWNFNAKEQILIDTNSNDLYVRGIWGETPNSWTKFAVSSEQLIRPFGSYLNALPAGVSALKDLPNNSVYVFGLSAEAVAAISDMPQADTQFTVMTFGGDTNFNAKCQMFFGMNGRKDIYMRQLWGGNTLGWQYLNPDDSTKRTHIYLGFENVDGITADTFIEAVEIASGYNYPTIHIAEGIYDIYEELGGSTYFTNPVNIQQPYIIPPNCEIIGHGNAILSLEVPTSVAAQNSTLMTNTSVIHTNGTSLTMENITLIGKNIRYDIHDESSAMGWNTIVNSHHYFKNVTSIMSNDGYGHGSNFGCGSASGATYVFDGCTFINTQNDNIHYHNWYNTKGERLTFKDCMFKGPAYAIGLGVHGEELSEVYIINCHSKNDVRVYSEAGTYTENCYEIIMSGNDFDVVVQNSITVNDYPVQKLGIDPYTMENVTINVDSTKVTGGTITAKKKDGVCYVFFNMVVFASSGNGISDIVTGLPEAQLQGGATFTGASAASTGNMNTNGDSIWIPTGGTAISANLGATYNQYHWTTLIYPCK